MLVISTQGRYREAGLPPERFEAGSAGQGRQICGQQAAGMPGGGPGPPTAPLPHCTCRRHKHVSSLWQLLAADQPAMHTCWMVRNAGMRNCKVPLQMAGCTLSDDIANRHQTAY